MKICKVQKHPHFLELEIFTATLPCHKVGQCQCQDELHNAEDHQAGVEDHNQRHGPTSGWKDEPGQKVQDEKRRLKRTVSRFL